MALGNIRNWFVGGSRNREFEETRATWEDTQARWRASPLGRQQLSDIVVAFIRHDVVERSGEDIAVPVLVALAEAVEAVLDDEDIGAMMPRWRAIESDPVMAVAFRKMLVRRRRYATDFQHIHEIVSRRLIVACQAIIEALPPSCLGNWDEEGASFEVPLIELLEDPAGLIDQLIYFPYDDDTLRLDLFEGVRATYSQNLVIASGLPPSTNPVGNEHRLVLASAQRNKSPAELADLYLAGTPFAPLMELPVPFSIPEEARFEHCHIVGGTGHGKTQLMQRMIHGDLVTAQRTKRSVVVVDSQGDLINRLVRLGLFSPDAEDSLADRLVVIDPADVEFPAALNLFDAHLDRVREYRPVDRERVLNGVVELYETFFGALLGAELTQKQGVIFKYLARLMITIPGATIHTLMELMEDGKPFKKHMDELEGSARYFFETEFFHPSFAATKKQILRRLWGVLSTPAFERMFAQPANKLDLFQAMQDGKIILINTAKDLLKQEGSQLFGRFFIAMLAQAALERSTVPLEDRTPTLVYVDEAQEYFDDNTETILNQARKYRVGLTVAHQTLDQLSPRLRSILHSNTSMKCAGGVSAKDARAFADELHTSADFIESMKRRPGKTEFAVWIKHQTPQAIRLAVPLGFLERQPLLTEEEYEALLARNRAAYCGTLADAARAQPKRSPPDEPTAEASRKAQRPRPAPPEEQQARAAPPPSDERRYEPGPEREEEPAAGPGAASEISGTDSSASEARAPPHPRAKPTESGKGGSQHRYVQHLVKRLAEDHGFRAVIEEPVPGGQVDVGLHRGDLSIACEISITSTTDYEAQNLAKCLRAGFTIVWAIAPDQKRQRALRRAAEARLAVQEMEKIQFLTPDEVVLSLEALATPEPEENTVLGYKVKVTRKVVSPEESKRRRENIARIVAGAVRERPED